MDPISIIRISASFTHILLEEQVRLPYSIAGLETICSFEKRHKSGPREISGHLASGTLRVRDYCFLLSSPGSLLALPELVQVVSVPFGIHALPEAIMQMGAK